MNTGILPELLFLALRALKLSENDLQESRAMLERKAVVYYLYQYERNKRLLSHFLGVKRLAIHYYVKCAEIHLKTRDKEFLDVYQRILEYKP